MVPNPAYIPITAAEFFEIGFPTDRKLELVNGVIVATAGGSQRHAEVQTNIIGALASRLRGSGCKPFSASMAVRTGECTIRYPDASILRIVPPERDDDRFTSEPIALFEVLSPSTADNDQRVKLAEYRSLASGQTIVFVDPADESVRVVQRTGPRGWHDEVLPDDAAIALPSLRITLPRAEVFARD